MQDSLDRVRSVIAGGLPDRAPLYDLLRNDAVITHFTGVPLTVENGAELVYKAYEPALDATRPMVKSPNIERIERTEDGRTQHIQRWTIWTEPHTYPDAESYRITHEQQLAASTDWSRDDQRNLENALTSAAAARSKLGEVFFFPGVPGPSVTSLYSEVGLEQFSYYLADYPGLMAEMLEQQTCRAIAWAEHLPDDHGIEAGFLGDDIAFKTATLLSPDWLRRQLFPRLARAIDVLHRRGIKVLFHSDGNLNAVLDDLVAAGIDGLNPIEVLAGMDVIDIHRRYPHLFLCGGIDVSQLLPFGKPQEVKDAVRRAVDGAEGRLMVGSSTELNNEVPLANYLALREAVLEP